MDSKSVDKVPGTVRVQQYAPQLYLQYIAKWDNVGRQIELTSFLFSRLAVDSAPKIVLHAAM